MASISITSSSLVQKVLTVSAARGSGTTNIECFTLYVWKDKWWPKGDVSHFSEASWTITLDAGYAGVNIKVEAYDREGEFIASDTKYVAQSTKYTISYENTDASGGSAPSSQTKTYSVPITLANNTGGMYRNGTTTTSEISVQFNGNGGSSSKTSQKSIVTKTTSYTLNGWGTTYGLKNYDLGDTYSSESSNTMYPYWDPNITITYTSITFPTKLQCTRYGYTLLGFDSNSSATTPTYEPGQEYTPTSSTTGLYFYAIWAQKSTLTLSATPDIGGTVSGAGMYDTGSLVSIGADANEGYTFKGWYENGQLIESERTCQIQLNSNRSLVAKFEETNVQYILWYNKNTTDTVTDMPNDQYYPSSGTTKDSYHTFTLTGSPNRLDYYFKGWSGSSTGTSAITTLTAYSHTPHRIVYAIWQDITYTVTFNKQEGVGGTDSVEVIYNQAMPTIYRPSRTHYDFQGYFSSPGGQGIQYYNYLGQGLRNWGTRTDGILYAYWTPKPYWVVTYDVNGGSGAVNPQIKYENESLILSDGTGAYRDGYGLERWCTQSSGSGGTSYNLDETYTENHGLILYAIWVKKDYQVTINIQPTGGGTVTGAGWYYRGDTVTLTATPKAKYEFLGWYKDGVLQSTSLSWVATSSIQSDLEYTAKFKPPIKAFHWTGTFGDTEVDNDATMIVKGQPSTNITADVWNNQLIPRIRALEELQGKTTSYIPTVNQGDIFTYTDFNYLRQAIANLNGGSSVTGVVVKGDILYATKFANDSTSIKNVLNYIINNT